MTHRRLFLVAILLVVPWVGMAREAKLVRYPHYHQGRLVFTYLGDIWTADENGQNVRRLTVHRARDVYPRSPPTGSGLLSPAIVRGISMCSSSPPREGCPRR